MNAVLTVYFAYHEYQVNELYRNYNCLVGQNRDQHEEQSLVGMHSAQDLRNAATNVEK